MARVLHLCVSRWASLVFLVPHCLVVLLILNGDSLGEVAQSSASTRRHSEPVLRADRQRPVPRCSNCADGSDMSEMSKRVNHHAVERFSQVVEVHAMLTRMLNNILVQELH